MKKFWGKTGWTCMAFVPVIASLFAQIVMGVILSIVLSVMALSQGLGYDESMAYVMDHATSAASILVLAYHVVSIPIFGVWYYFGCGRPKFVNPLKQLKGIRVPVIVILSLGLCIFANAFVFLGTFLFPDVIAAYTELMEAAGMGTNAYTIIAAVLLAPIGEELVCRGIAWYYGEKVVSGMKNQTVAFWIVNCITALGFGIMHANLVQGTYAFFLGLGLGWLRKRYNSLIPAMLAHAVINFTSSFLAVYLLGWIPETLVAAILLTVVSIVIIFSAVILECKCGKKADVA